jgi:hypothetical protein
MSLNREKCDRPDSIYSYGTLSLLNVLRICNQQVVGSSPTAGSLSKRDLRKM